MAHEYSWESSSSYIPPQRQGVGWYALVAVILALWIHVAFLVVAGNTFYRADVDENSEVPEEWVSKRMKVQSVEVVQVNDAEVPPAEELERPEVEQDFIDDTEEAIAELQNINIDIDTQIAEADLPEMKIERPALAGTEDGVLLNPVIGPDAKPDIPDPGKMKIDFPDALANQLTVVDQGSSFADILDPDSITASLENAKGAGGVSAEGSIEGYTGLAAYARMSPGDLQQNKASIGSDLLFEYNESILRDDARISLLTVAQLIDRNPGMYCWVEGHTDLFGGDEFNEELSRKRAKAVKDWLVNSLQLDGDFISVRAFGRSEPIIKEGDQVQQAPNRRVDIKMRNIPPPMIVPNAEPVLVSPGRAVVVEDDEAGQVELPLEVPDEEIPAEEPDIPRAIIVPEDEPSVEIPKAVPVGE